ncbi:uncharacterized protein LY89DRAFT_598535 [Mollisia scopiformis]|uniref:MINDY deubiquitinase domain-containing protein n=1 Tax=Mollisia scopiformis TaxID=149040 RepID=A0A132B993_MOLSC|nr:uncharacterized protein LY89DRAFT_598535 [Mollisia scopiformis]KUJ08965.1 hypothetical protein LY89DRAFT_598535 [Mollisia scopiformis]
MNAWSGEGLENNQNTQHANNSLPDLLRAGPPHGYTPSSSQEALRPQATGTNPFLNKQRTGSSNAGSATGHESSADAWGEYDTPAPPTTAPPPPPVPHDSIPPSEQFEHLPVSEPSTNPWQPALDKQATGQAPPPIPPMQRQDSGNDVWSGPPAREAPQLPPVDSSQPVLINLEEPESPAWDEDDDEPAVHEMPADNVAENQQMHEDQHAWDDQTAGHPLQQHPVTTIQHIPPTLVDDDPIQQGDGWNMVDHDPLSIGSQQNGVITGSGEDIATYAGGEQEYAPPLPPRTSQEHPPAQPPRPVVDTAHNRSTSSITSPTAAARKQKKETYEIKRITWHDVSAAENPRVSPILVQNANGPCPLLALVNALTLSTPAHVETALVETLRSREQVSLGLLLDAVFDELMSGRRGDAAQDLPDVSDLYSFLITLHTGMNVNPRFFPPPATRTSGDIRRSMTHVHPSEREALLPGTFEETREMKLYSTFSIPLIHGWLPERDSSAFTALDRSAKSYEDAQNLMFHEEELEDKLMREGLSFEEQATLEDIATIKAFFASNATQLTPYGLDRITTSVGPGSVAILFRNDHFSTLYRHPDTLQLLQLVTDMGYAGHEEVVWESLIDVNGENAEFFSGDFRLVGGASSTSPPAPTQSNDGWTTVTGRRNQNQPSHEPNLSTAGFDDNIPTTPRSPNTEQEDHDLALALQLQEEEEERHRSEIARRRRETELSQQYIEQQGQGQNIPVSQRGGSAPRGQGRGRGRGNPPPQTPQEARPAIPPRRNNPGGQVLNAAGQPVDPEAGVDAPPPSYEQAANQAAYNPPVDHPAHPSASPNGTANGRRMSAYTANSQGVASGSRNNRRQTGSGPTLIEQIPGRRATSGSMEAGTTSRDKDCVVM